MSYWIVANDNSVRVCVSIGSVVDRCKLLLALGMYAFMCLVVHLRGSSYWSSRPLCRDGGCCPLACRHCLVESGG
jgi:hypothetical protein